MSVLKWMMNCKVCRAPGFRETEKTKKYFPEKKIFLNLGMKGNYYILKCPECDSVRYYFRYNFMHPATRLFFNAFIVSILYLIYILVRSFFK